MIYLDHAADTPILPSVYLAMEPWMSGKQYGNPSSLHSAGREAKKVIEESRSIIAKALNAEDESSIIFTSGGTESNNLAIGGTTYHLPVKKMITSQVEHSSILNQWKGYIRYNDIFFVEVDVDNNCLINIGNVKKVVESQDLAVASFMLANNEVGTIEPIKEISEICHEFGTVVHTDAVQAFGHMEIDVQKLGVDLLSLSGHKFGAPYGTGALYISKRVIEKVRPIIFGGGQEKKLRAGTENVPGIVGLGEAIRKMNVKATMAQNKMLKYDFLTVLLDEFDNDFQSNGIRINCADVETLNNILSITVMDVESESLLLLMDLDGVCISAASACSAGSKEPSHVLHAMGMSDHEAHCTIRISFGSTNTPDTVRQAAKILAKNIKRIRAMYKS